MKRELARARDLSLFSKILDSSVMAATFAQTTRALESERTWRSRVAFGGVVALLCAWGAWFFRAEITEWSASDAARIEVERAAHSIDAPVAGRIAINRIVLGAAVRAGEIIVELDSESERRRLAEERARLAAIEPQLVALRRTLAAQEEVLVTERGVSVTAAKEGRARQREAEVAARLATEEAKRAGTLYDGGAISQIDLLRLSTEAERRIVAQDALGFGVARQREELRTRETRDTALIEELRKDIVDLEGRRVVVAAAIDLLGYEIDRRKLVAPVDGRVADARTLKVGAFVKEGERLGSIVPDGKPRIIASFAPGTALGRVRVGQPARARLDTFPWIEYGSVPATVIAIGSEPRDGKIRVELDIEEGGNPRIPLEHGLVGTTEIAVGKATLATLLMRALGRRLSPHPTNEVGAP
jgi:membrane fusion protein (multidrug efflux system)